MSKSSSLPPTPPTPAPPPPKEKGSIIRKHANDAFQRFVDAVYLSSLGDDDQELDPQVARYARVIRSQLEVAPNTDNIYKRYGEELICCRERIGKRDITLILKPESGGVDASMQLMQHINMNAQWRRYNLEGRERIWGHLKAISMAMTLIRTMSSKTNGMQSIEHVALDIVNGVDTDVLDSGNQMHIVEASIGHALKGNFIDRIAKAYNKSATNPQDIIKTLSSFGFDTEMMSEMEKKMNNATTPTNTPPKEEKSKDDDIDQDNDDDDEDLEESQEDPLVRMAEIEREHNRRVAASASSRDGGGGHQDDSSSPRRRRHKRHSKGSANHRRRHGGKNGKPPAPPPPQLPTHASSSLVIDDSGKEKENTTKTTVSTGTTTDDACETTNNTNNEEQAPRVNVDNDADDGGGDSSSEQAKIASNIFQKMCGDGTIDGILPADPSNMSEQDKSEMMKKLLSSMFSKGGVAELMSSAAASGHDTSSLVGNHSSNHSSSSSSDDDDDDDDDDASGGGGIDDGCQIEQLD